MYNLWFRFPIEETLFNTDSKISMPPSLSNSIFILISKKEALCASSIALDNSRSNFHLSEGEIVGHSENGMRTTLDIYLKCDVCSH